MTPKSNFQAHFSSKNSKDSLRSPHTTRNIHTPRDTIWISGFRKRQQRSAEDTWIFLLQKQTYNLGLVYSESELTTGLLYSTKRHERVITQNEIKMNGKSLMKLFILLTHPAFVTAGQFRVFRYYLAMSKCHAQGLCSFGYHNNLHKSNVFGPKTNRRQVLVMYKDRSLDRKICNNIIL